MEQQVFYFWFLSSLLPMTQPKHTQSPRPLINNQTAWLGAIASHDTRRLTPI